ncbi:hypothetical protein GOACH_35_00060 [Gordonia aichiensis NBRC 108223]|uniref:Uncharacterized protein n=2 Tax=Gordonia aichiensis TaxID=36820 RepID=L7KQS4_9ACTN|nr:hypothetical protein GOACH_35_00060 [Gordonia aichiensis NBRC 108223]
MTTATNPPVGLPTTEESPMSKSVVASARINGEARHRTQNPLPADKRTTERNLGVDRRGLDDALGLDLTRGADEW